MSNVGSVTHLLPTVNEGFVSTLSSTITSGATTVPLTSVTNLVDASTFVGIVEPGATNQQVFTGRVDFTNSQITGVVWTRGTNVSHAGGAAVVDYVTGTAFNMLSRWAKVQHNDDGTHAAVTASSVVVATDVTVGGNNTVVGATTVAGTLTANGAIAGITPDKFTNPYSFSVYRNAAWTTPTGFGLVEFDTASFDTSNNVDIVTHKGRFTAPIDGNYRFEASVFETGTPDGAHRALTFYKNGVEIRRGNEFSTGGGLNTTVHGSSGLVQLDSGDYIEVYTYGNDRVGGTGEGVVWFSGELSTKV